MLRHRSTSEVVLHALLVCLLGVFLAVGLGGCGRRGGTDGRGAPPPGGIGLSIDALRESVRGANIVLCIIDAARADHVGCYGYSRETTPNIDRLAAESLVFERHFVQYPETKPSTATLFTSQYPDTHLAYEARRPPEAAFTLAQGLRSAGLHTALFSQNGYASPMWGIGTHFDEAYYEPHLKEAGRDVPAIWKPEALLEIIAPWMEADPRQPFFAYIHFMPPHGPYIAPPDVKHRFRGDDPPNAWRSEYPFEGVEIEQRKGAASWPQERFINLYDGNMVYADWAVGEVERLLREAGLFENTLLIITADHGEAFGEHGYRGHTFSAFDESIHVPLLMRLPGETPASGRISGLTQVIDLLPTILDLFGVEYPAGEIQGRSLVPLLSGEAEEVNPYVFARAGGDPPSYIVRSRDHMLLLYRGGKLRALYDLDADPRQTRNVIDDQPERAAELMEVFRTFAQSQVAPPMDFIDPGAPAPQLPDAAEVHVTDEMQRSLRALGYLK